MRLENFSNTLLIDSATQECYIKIPIADLCELSSMHESLLEILILLSSLESSPVVDTHVGWLSRIVLSSYPGDELEGFVRHLSECTKAK